MNYAAAIIGIVALVVTASCIQIDGNVSVSSSRDVSTAMHAIEGHWVSIDEDHYYISDREIIRPNEDNTVWYCYVYEVESSTEDPHAMTLKVFDVTADPVDFKPNPYNTLKWQLLFDDKCKQLIVDSSREIDGWNYQLDLGYVDRKTMPD